MARGGGVRGMWGAWVIGAVALMFGAAACTTKDPDGEADLAWIRSNGAIDVTPNGWERIDDAEQAAYSLGGESFPTLVRREYLTGDTGAAAVDTLTALAIDAGWEPGWNACFTREMRVGFRHPERDDALFAATLTPDGEQVRVDAAVVINRPGWARAGDDPPECFDGVVERVRLLDELPPLRRVSPEEIEALLTASEVERVFGRSSVTARVHDSVRMQYLDGDEFLVTVDSAFPSDIPELRGLGRHDVFVLREESYATIYQVGLGDTAVVVTDHTQSGADLIDAVAEALRS